MTTTRISTADAARISTMRRMPPADAVFDESAADRVVGFFERHLRHVKGRWAGDPFVPLGWQRELLRELFGWHRTDGTRRYRQAYVEVPRKNGKSTLAAGIALKLARADAEPGAEVYSAAADRDQARIVFDTARRMVEASPSLRRGARVMRDAIVWRSTGCVYRVLSAEAYTKHGLNAHGIIFDELHAQPTRELWDVLNTSVGARTQPLTVAITTAGTYDPHAIGWEIHDYATRVADGRVADDAFLGLIYGVSPEAAWDDEASWVAANPSLDETITRDYLARECERARAVPAYENTFRRLHLCQWTSQFERWIPMDKWDACATAPTIPEGGDVVIAVDAALRRDTTAVVTAHRDSGGTTHALFEIFRADERTGVMEFEAIEEYVRRLIRRYTVRELVFDPAYFIRSAMLLADEVPIRDYTQQGVGMVRASGALWDAIIDGKLRHGGDPDVREQADAAGARETDRGWRLSKRHSSRSIDAIVALAMAIDRLNHWAPAEPGIYVFGA